MKTGTDELSFRPASAVWLSPCWWACCSCCCWGSPRRSWSGCWSSACWRLEPTVNPVSFLLTDLVNTLIIYWWILKTFLAALQGSGTATGSTTSTELRAPKSPMWGSPQTLRFTCRFKKRGWLSVSLSFFFSSVLSNKNGRKKSFLCFSVIMVSVGEAIILLTLIFLRTRILIAIALIQESSKWV